jgi:Uma2 family endonuclease
MDAGEASRRDRSSTPRCIADTPQRGEPLTLAHAFERGKVELMKQVSPLREMTARELLQYSHEPYRQELVRGILYEMEPPGFEHGLVAHNIGVDLIRHVTEADLGIAMSSEVGFLLASDPDTVRAPDAFFISRERVAIGGIPKGYWRGPPDLAIEVVSPNDRRREVEAKAREWLAAGARAVIVVDPPTRTATIFRSHEDAVVLHGDERVELGDVVPGWSPRVGDFFV